MIYYKEQADHYRAQYFTLEQQFQAYKTQAEIKLKNNN